MHFFIILPVQLTVKIYIMLSKKGVICIPRLAITPF